MRTIETPREAMPALLDILQREGPRSGGNLARKLMGAGLLPNKPESYVLVSEALAEWLALGRVTKAGNGKSVHWKSKP